MPQRTARRRASHATVAAALLAALAAPALAQPRDADRTPDRTSDRAPTARLAEGRLTMGVGSPVSSLDPHYHQLRSNAEVSGMIFDTLLEADPQLRPGPGLAESWRLVDEATWELRLRPGVRFQNGSDFTADDVAFTVDRVRGVVSPGASYASHLVGIRRVEVIDPLTVRLHTDGPFPLLPTYLTQVFMLDRETHSGATTEEFNATRRAIGTGPYRVTAHAPGSEISFVRNEGYWGERPAWREIRYRMITTDSSRVAALLSGDVDFIDQVPTGDLASLRADGRVSLSETVSLRTMYLSLDLTREGRTYGIADNDGRPMDRNPLTDPRVRQALSLAIDRRALVERVMENAAVPTGQFLPEGIYGHDPGIPVPATDPARARALLAEAGYPGGFRISLNGPNDRYMNDARLLQAIGGMWTRVGVRAEVNAMPYATFIAQANRRDFAAALLSWGNSTGEPSVALNSVLATPDRAAGRGVANRVHYSNPAMDEALRAALRENDDARREELLRRATRLAMDDLALVPTHIQKALWAMRRGLTYQARADEQNAPGNLRLADRP